MRPRVIIVDEPTTGQDAKQSFEIMNFLKEMNQSLGHTIIIITHDMPIVAQYARRVVVMGMGRILADGPTNEVFKGAEILAETFIEPPQITKLAQRVAPLGFDPGTLTVGEMLEQYKRLSAQFL